MSVSYYFVFIHFQAFQLTKNVETFRGEEQDKIDKFVKVSVFGLH